MAGVDPLNQFPNSVMARAVRKGQSQFRSVDSPAIIVAGEQNNVNIAAASTLTVPAKATYAVVTAVGGPLYFTYDGSVPSPANYAGVLQAGMSLPVSGASMSTLKVIGTTMSVSYWK